MLPTFARCLFRGERFFLNLQLGSSSGRFMWQYRQEYLDHAYDPCLPIRRSINSTNTRRKHDDPAKYPCLLIGMILFQRVRPSYHLRAEGRLHPR